MSESEWSDHDENDYLHLITAEFLQPVSKHYSYMYTDGFIFYK